VTVSSRTNILQQENARLTQELNTSKAQAQAYSEARKSAEGRIKQLEMDLYTAQKEGEQLKQQNIELSSRAWSLRDRAERSSQVLDEAFTVLQKWQSSPFHCHRRGS
jgi:septal ring factor EnvC (AmiA/AmiB activator)